MTTTARIGRCRECGAEVQRMPYGKPRMFCSPQCGDKWRSRNRRVGGTTVLSTGASYLAHYGLAQIGKLWFMYEGRAYQVEDAPIGIFTAWMEPVITEAVPQAHRKELLHMVKQPGDEKETLLSRWYALEEAYRWAARRACDVALARLHLFQSEKEAQGWE